MCKEPPAAARRALSEQQPREVSLNLRFPSPHGHLPEPSRDIIGPVDSVRIGALVLKVPLAEEPDESATDRASV